MGKGHFITVSSTVLYLTSPKLERAISKNSSETQATRHSLSS